MATSQNGWTVHTSSSGLVPLAWVTGRVDPDPVHDVFAYFCDRFNREVEKIRPDWSWGWAYRPIRGSSSGYSNHASATAIDLNAPAHPLGVRGTFSPKQKAAIHKILDDLQGVIRAGLDYSGRADEMHFEVNASRASVERVARLIRTGTIAKPTGTPTYKIRYQPVSLSRLRLQFARAAGITKGKVRATNDVARVQRSLNALKYKAGPVDGICGRQTLRAWRKWETSHRGTGRPRIPDQQSLNALAKRRGFRVTA